MTDQEAAYIKALRVADIKVRLKNRKPPVDDTLVRPTEEPRYDDVFFKGLAALDACAGEPITRRVIPYSPELSRLAEKEEGDE